MPENPLSTVEKQSQNGIDPEKIKNKHTYVIRWCRNTVWEKTGSDLSR